MKLLPISAWFFEEGEAKNEVKAETILFAGDMMLGEDSRAE